MNFRIPPRTASLLALLLLIPMGVQAHSFGVVYTLPVPFWLYAWGAAATLLLSFVVVGLFAQGDSEATTAPAPADSGAAGRYRWALPAAAIWLLRGLSLAALMLCIATGFFGTPNPYGNFNMTWFWILFVLGYAYLTVLIGNLYALISPWHSLALLIGRLWPRYYQGWLRAPTWLGYWPAVLLYFGFIWLELFGGTKPYTLSLALGTYSLINLLGVLLLGGRYWFRHAELFAVFLGLIARMAPVEYAQERSNDAQDRRLRLRWPCSGLLEAPAGQPGLLVFVLFMLSATAFDGLHEAQAWAGLYWLQFYPAVLAEFLGSNPVVAWPRLREIWWYWQSFWLAASPWIYLGFYLGGIAALQRIAGLRGQLLPLAMRYLYSLLPIVLVYHITHYYTLIQTQGIKILGLVSDPFGRGWNLFGSAGQFMRSNVPDSATVWHVQVGLIVAGHVLSVYIAHLIALRQFGDRRRATLSQIPMLVLMVAFTVAGLWILSLPLGAASP